MLEVTCGFGALLSNQKIDVHSPSDTNEIKSLFHLVKIRDKQKLISTLLEKGQMYNPGELNENGETPLMVACKHKKPANAFTLLEFYGDKCLPDFISSDGYSTVYYTLNSLNLFKRFLRYQCVIDQLDYVYPCGDNILTLIIEKEKTNRCNHQDNLDIYKSGFLSKEYMECIEVILENISIQGLNHRNKDGKTPLMLLIELSEYKVARKAVLKGANTQYYDNEGYSTISYVLYDLKNSPSSDTIEFCLMCFEQEQSSVSLNSEFKEYTLSDFVEIGDVAMPNIKSSYGDIRWALDKYGNISIIKFYRSYEDEKLISNDFVKELVFIKKLKSKNAAVVDIRGIYIDDDKNVHLVFEPLALTLNDYFKLLKMYSKIDKNCEIMAKMRIEATYNKLRSSLDIIHGYGYLHNDIKLNNMMIGYDGQPRYIDFGLSNFVGFSPYERVINKYITTDNVKAPDYGKQITINFVKKISDGQFMSYRYGVFNTSRKSYNSDVYSLSVSFIQGILGHSRRYVSFEGIIYDIRNLQKMSDENDKKFFEDKIDILKISDSDLDKLKSFSFYQNLMMGVSIDSNQRSEQPTQQDVNEKQITEFRSHIEFIDNKIKHYSANELKNMKYELSKYKTIFEKYKGVKINVTPSHTKTIVSDVFNGILSVIKNKVNLDTYYNAIYRSINYIGPFDIKVVCITYFYIFSHIFENESPCVELIASKFNIDVDILTGNINILMAILLPSIEIIPFVLIVESMVINLQLNGINKNIISDVERNVFSNLTTYLSGNVPENMYGKEIYFWDFVQCFSYTACSCAPFEISYESETIIDLFRQF